MNGGRSPEKPAAPQGQRPAASASETGDAQASDGGTAVSGSVVGSNLSSTRIAHQSNRWYTLFLWERAAGWSLLPVVVGLIAVAALVRQPQGRMGQFVLVYMLLAAAILASVLLAVLAGEPVGRGRAAPSPARTVGGISSRAGLRLLTVMLCLAAAGSGLLRMEYLRDHGEVDVSGFRLEKATGVGNGEWATLVLDEGAERDRMKATVSIKDPNPNGGSCARGTDLDVALEGGTPTRTNESLSDGGTADLRLEDKREIRVRLTVHTIPGCRVDLGVTGVLLYG